MEFMTPVRVEPFDNKIDHIMTGLSMGSCFAGNMAAKMKRAKLRITDNPFGVLFNPVSIADSLDALHAGRRYTVDDLVREGDVWSSFAFHGSFSSTDPQAALSAMNRCAAEGERALKNVDYVIITFGTAWVFELAAEARETFGAQGGKGSATQCGARDTEDYGTQRNNAPGAQGTAGSGTHRIEASGAPLDKVSCLGGIESWGLPQPATVVANCHRFPARTFVRRRLTAAEIVERYDALFDTALRGKHIIFTVSPVRHLKDGAVENTLSKSVLIEAVHQLVARHPSAVYFPAFEIMNDELRDYRFYAGDMVHPSAVAVEYIWEKFRSAALTPRAVDAAREAEKLAAAMEHRPLDPMAAAHREFLAAMSARVEELIAKYPEIDFTAETEYFSVPPSIQRK